MELLTQLAEIGATLKRLPGDRFQVRGDVPDDLQEQLRIHKSQLLELIPDPLEEIRRLHRDAIAESGDILPPTWFGTPEQWAEFDALDDRFALARQTGDVDAARRTYADYVTVAQQQARDSVRRRETCMQCGYPSDTESYYCSACDRIAAPPVKNVQQHLFEWETEPWKKPVPSSKPTI